MGLARGFGILTALALTFTVAACGGQPDSAPTSSPSPTGTTSSPTPTGSPSASGKPVTLTFGVYGDSAAVSAYKRIAEAYTDIDPDLTLKVRSWPDQDRMLTDIASGGDVPDVFLTPGASLPDLIGVGAIQPVDSFLDARNVDLGDGYSRNAIEAFSADRRLQCMPYYVSPRVVYVNTDLVDFGAMAQQGLPAPTNPAATSWSIDQFQAAMQYAARPRQGIRGVYVDPSVAGLAPWITGAGGSLLDNADNPTRTAFADSLDALSSILPILGNSRYRLGGTPAHGLKAFEDGKVATLVGERSLVPQLRRVRGLHWDVMAMPGGGGTSGDYTGLCLSAKPSDTDSAADFLTYLITSDAVTRLAESGSVVPVNQQVAYSDTFLQPQRPPSHAQLFTTALKTMHPLPAVGVLDQLDQTVGPQVRRLLTPAGQANLDPLTAQIDDRSRTVFGGQPTSSPTPTG